MLSAADEDCCCQETDEIRSATRFTSRPRPQPRRRACDLAVTEAWPMSMTTAAALTRAPRVCHPLARPQASPDMTCTSYGTLGLIWSEGGERERERGRAQGKKREESWPTYPPTRLDFIKWNGNPNPCSAWEKWSEMGSPYLLRMAANSILTGENVSDRKRASFFFASIGGYRFCRIRRSRICLDFVFMTCPDPLEISFMDFVESLIRPFAK